MDEYPSMYRERWEIREKDRKTRDHFENVFLESFHCLKS
jgi:hypothetical protein